MIKLWFVLALNSNFRLPQMNPYYNVPPNIYGNFVPTEPQNYGSHTIKVNHNEVNQEKNNIKKKKSKIPQGMFL